MKNISQKPLSSLIKRILELSLNDSSDVETDAQEWLKGLYDSLLDLEN